MRPHPAFWIALLVGGHVIGAAIERPVPAAAPPIAGVSRFAIAASPIGLTGDVRPREYLGVLGRRAAWLGTETGAAEVWVHPLKLATALSLSFHVTGDAGGATPGAEVARTVEIRPELTTIVYTHPTFTVRQHVLVPLDEPGAIVLLDVDTVTPLEITVGFQPVLQYAWPGALGGQYATWIDEERAFLLSESLRRHNAYIGSPWAIRASSPPAHALPDSPNQFVLAVDPERARREFVPVVIAAGIAARDEVLATYHRLLREAPALYEARREHAARLLGRTATITTPEHDLDLALEWAKVDLDEQVVCNPDLGCGLVAGWGPSGRGARAGFGWFFGGDAAINSWAMSAVGMAPEVALGLRFLAKYQREDGKIPHEISQAAARLPWFTEFPYAYSHADTTPFWIVAVWRHWRSGGDRAFVEDLWPNVVRAYRWCLGNDGDGDGLIENTTGGLGAIEVGEIGAAIHQDVYLAAVWVEALRAMRELSTEMHDEALAKEAARTFDRASASLNDRYWLPAVAHHAFGILSGGATNEALTVWPATAASFALLAPDRARATLSALAGPRIATPWGARMLASDHRLYDPTHYNMGAVWPFVTGFAALGQYQYDRPWAGLPFVRALGRMTFDWARGRHPELLSGDYYRPLDTAVPQQFFATSMYVTPLIDGLFGFDAHAAANRARLAPSLPPSWTHAAVRRLPVGTKRLDVELDRRPGALTARLRAAGGGIDVDFAPTVPPGAVGASFTVGGRRLVPGAPADGSFGLTARPSIAVRVDDRPTMVTVTWTGGLDVEQIDAANRPGDPANAARIVDFTWTGDRWLLDVQGRPGTHCDVHAYGPPPATIRGAEVIERRPDVLTLRVPLPAGGAGVATARVELLPH